MIDRLPVSIGHLASQNVWNDLMGYTVVGGASFSIVNNNLRMSRTGTPDYLNYLRYDGFISCLEKWKKSILIQLPNAPDANSYGCGFGIQTTSASGNRSVFVQFNASTGATYGGKTILLAGITTGNGGIILTSSSTKLRRDAGDVIKMTVSRNGLNFACTTENITAGTSHTVSFNFSLIYSQTNNQHNTGTVAFYSIGGTQDILFWDYSSDEKMNPNACFVTDSIGYGAWAGVQANRYADLIQALTTKSITVNSGSGDTTQQWLNKIDNLKFINAKYYLLGTLNDYRLGISEATFQANYISVCNQIRSLRKTIVHLIPTAANDVDCTPVETFITNEASFANDIKINLFTATRNGTMIGLNPTYDSGDGVHPNSTGHIVIKDSIINALPDII